MSEYMPSSPDEKGPVAKKSVVITYLTNRLEKARRVLTAQEERIEYWRQHSRPRTRPKPRSLERGSADEKDWEIAARGDDEDEDYYTSPEAQDDLQSHRENVAILERALLLVGEGDRDLIEEYWQELNKTQPSEK